LLKGLDVVAIPSVSEAGPLLPMEAMVAGVPIIGTDCIGLREVLRDTPSRMVRAANSVELANAIEAEMRNPSTAEARAFAPQARSRFDVRQQAGRMEEVILRLVGRGAGVP
jgi:glycosyltransferase involved in cell wall biosynthesis